jgi:hypothetical protein
MVNRCWGTQQATLEVHKDCRFSSIHACHCFTPPVPHPSMPPELKDETIFTGKVGFAMLVIAAMLLCGSILGYLIMRCHPDSKGSVLPNDHHTRTTSTRATYRHAIAPHSPILPP